MGNEIKVGQKFTAHSLSKEEIEEMLSTVVTMGIIFKGQMGVLPKIMKFVEESGCKVIFRKSGRDKLIITVQTNEGGNNAND